MMDMEEILIPIEFKFYARPGVNIDHLKNYLLMSLDEVSDSLLEGAFREDGLLLEAETREMFLAGDDEFMMVDFQEG